MNDMKMKIRLPYHPTMYSLVYNKSDIFLTPGQAWALPYKYLVLWHKRWVGSLITLQCIPQSTINLIYFKLRARHGHLLTNVLSYGMKIRLPYCLTMYSCNPPSTFNLIYFQLRARNGYLITNVLSYSMQKRLPYCLGMGTYLQMLQ